VIFTKKDFGPMKKAEERTKETGELMNKGSIPMVSDEITSFPPKEGIEAKKKRGDWADYGRPSAIEMPAFIYSYNKVLNGETRPVECMKELGLSKATYYRYRDRYNSSHAINNGAGLDT
jgi:hypothetical protein